MDYMLPCHNAPSNLKDRPQPIDCIPACPEVPYFIVITFCSFYLCDSSTGAFILD
ncbi:hypothetical protein RSAG8_10670, partial [Rhizoctonia solani AG-8 WAC10335]